MPTKLVALTLCCVLGLFVSPGAAQAGHAWGPYHWARTANPFVIQLGDNVDGRWEPALYVASNDWTASPVLDTAVVPGFTAPDRCTPTMGRVEVCNASYGYTGWLGLASIDVTSDLHITWGAVRLNDTYFDVPPYNTSEWRTSVTCQEIGHVLGLAHQDEDPTNPNLDTCMDYTDYPSSNQHPNLHDYQQLNAIYAYPDSHTTVGAAASSGHRVGTYAPGWGRLIDGSWASGRSTYWRYVAGGGAVITVVTWA